MIRTPIRVPVPREVRFPEAPSELALAEPKKEHRLDGGDVIRRDDVS